MARSRTTAEPGNVIALKHGAISERIVALSSPLTGTEIIEAIRDSGNYLLPADGFLVERAARQLTRLRMLDEFLDRLGGSPIDSRGRARKCMGLLMSLERQFSQTCNQLGLSPLARAQLIGDTASARRDAEATAAQRELREKYTTPEAQP